MKRGGSGRRGEEEYLGTVWPNFFSTLKATLSLKQKISVL